MKRSESIIKIAPALLKAQIQMEGAVKGATNPFYKSKYADYPAVLEACKDSLNTNGIVILQPHNVEIKDGFVVTTVETILLHESGEFISSETVIKSKSENDPQQQGSGITFARRYGLQSLVALPTEDDDGEGAMNRNNKPQGREPAKPTQSATPVKNAAAPVKADPPKAETPVEAPARRRVAVPTEAVKPESKPTEAKAQVKQWE